MTEYEKHAKDFLDACNAKIKITFVGKEINHLWNEDKPRNKYHWVITTPRGSAEGDFWDSFHNTELLNMSYVQFYENVQRKSFDAVVPADTPDLNQFYKMLKEAKPNAYSILSCLEKYEIRSMYEFMYEFGYEIKSAKDFANFLEIYKTSVKQYNDLCRIFTPEQMVMLREIY